MIRPAHFGFNNQTAQNNSFQTNDEFSSTSATSTMAIKEFDTMVTKLRDHGISVTVFQDTSNPVKPDAIFPNNWISFHDNGAVITYPMFAPNRRIERREDIIDRLKENFEVSRRYSFEHYEEDDLFLEGTGSMIFDRESNIVYACISQRTDATLIDKFCVLMGASRVVFHSVDKEGGLVYHTNVIMALGREFAVICMDSVKDSEEKKTLLNSFKKTGKQIVEITQDQVEKFAGNMLEVKSKSGDSYLIMSQTAYDSLDESQINSLEKMTKILPMDIPTIERYGGGSVRCMMAEVFLPRK